MQYTKDELVELYSERPSSHDLCNLQTRRKLAFELDQARIEKDRAYEERNQLVLLLASVFGGVLHRASDAEVGWSSVLLIELPSGQISFHLPDSMIATALTIEKVANEVAKPSRWDGHGHREKWTRISDFTHRRNVPPGKEADTTPDQ